MTNRHPASLHEVQPFNFRILTYSMIVLFSPFEAMGSKPRKSAGFFVSDKLSSLLSVFLTNKYYIHLEITFKQTKF